MLPCGVIKASASFKWLEYYKSSCFQFGEQRNVWLRTCPLNNTREGSSQKPIHVTVENSYILRLVTLYLTSTICNIAGRSSGAFYGVGLRSLAC